jgi:hypothetical protein
MNMSLYTSMSSIQIHVYYLIFQNELFVINFLINKLIYNKLNYHELSNLTE